MRLRSSALFLLLFILPCAVLLAQKPPITFQHLTLDEGYSESTTRFIAEDAIGYMWIGSEDGLNKFDGYKFTSYRNNVANPYSISGNDNKEYLNDSNGDLWIATRSGLNLYDRIYDRFYNFHTNVYPCFKDLDGDIESLTEDEKGNIWVSAGSEGLFKISSLKEKPLNYISPSQDDMRQFFGIKADKKGKIWIGTRDGLFLFDIASGKFTDLRDKFGRGYQVRKIFIEDKFNRVWVSTTDGVKIIDLTTWKMKEYRNRRFDPQSLNGNNILTVIPYHDGNYLIGIDGGGIDYFDIKKDIFYHYTTDNESQLSCNNITYLLKDSKENLWAGTFLNGVDFSNTTTNLFAMVRNNPLSESSIKKGIVTNYLKDHNGNLWAATDGGGLYLRKKNTEAFQIFNPSPAVYDLMKFPIISLAEDKQGILWLTTYGSGLLSLNPSTGQIKIYKHDPNDSSSIGNNNLRTILIRNDEIWTTGYYSGISVLNKKTQKFRHYRYDKKRKNSISSDWAQTLMVDKHGTLWIGTFRGLNRYNPETDDFSAYYFNHTDYSFIACNYIQDVIEVSDKHLWLGTNAAGAIKFNTENKSYQFFSVKNGLSGNTVKSIMEDNNGNLWMATNNGITKLSLADMKAVAYTIQDGAPPYSYYVNAKYKDESGRIYFGNSKGFLMINPIVQQKNNFAPPVVFTSIKVMGNPVSEYLNKNDTFKQINYIKEIELDYNENAISFEFAALNYNNTQRNQYTYKLEGFEEKWKTAGNQRTATYTNLNPGKYVFKVKGSNNDNLWNKREISISIVISPPWWKTWWFILIQTIVFMVILYLIYMWRLQTMRKKNLLLEKMVRIRTEELNQSNQQLEAFIYKASHDIKGPLRSIIGLTIVGKKDIKDEMSLTYFDHILKSTRKLDNLLGDMLELTKVKEAKVTCQRIYFQDIVQEAISSFEHLEGFRFMNFDIVINDSIEFYSDRKLIYSVVQNLVENPIKYRDPEKEKCYLHIQIITSEDDAELIFSDNGIGIPYEIQSRVFEMFFKANERSKDTGLGLYIVKTTVEKLKGTIALESIPGHGSTFTVRLANRPI